MERGNIKEKTPCKHRYRSFLVCAFLHVRVCVSLCYLTCWARILKMYNYCNFVFSANSVKLFKRSFAVYSHYNQHIINYIVCIYTGE